MGRSLAKGPFVDDHLMKKVEAMNVKSGKSSAHVVAALDVLPGLSATRWLSITARSSFRCTSPRHGGTQTGRVFACADV
jgi:hypothetical protein